MRSVTAIERPEGECSAFRQELVEHSEDVPPYRILHLGLAPGEEMQSMNLGEERFIYLRSGAVEITAGTESVTLRDGGYIFLPKAKAHRVRNIGDASATMLDVCASIDVEAQTSTSSVADESLSNLGGKLNDGGFRQHQSHQAQGQTFDTKMLADRSTGAARLKVFAALVKPGSGMGLHIHNFDQFYLMLEGTMDIQVGLAKASASADSLIAFPAGVVHANRNSSPELIRQITVNIQDAPPSTFEVALSEVKR